MMTLATRINTPFMEMEARDEQQILATLEGKVLTEFVYKVEGKLGLSLVGVNHMCFKMGHIKVDPASARIEYDEREDEYTAYIVAVNEKYELSAMGVSTQPRMMEIHVKDDQGKWVKHRGKDVTTPTNDILETVDTFIDILYSMRKKARRIR